MVSVLPPNIEIKIFDKFFRVPLATHIMQKAMDWA